MLHVTTRDVCGGGELGQLWGTPSSLGNPPVPSRAVTPTKRQSQSAGARSFPGLGLVFGFVWQRTRSRVPSEWDLGPAPVGVSSQWLAPSPSLVSVWLTHGYLLYLVCSPRAT